MKNILYKRDFLIHTRKSSGVGFIAAFAMCVCVHNVQGQTVDPNPASFDSIQEDQLLHDQPGVVRYALGSGLEIVLVPLKEESVQGQVECWLSVRAGSFGETEAQRGASAVMHEIIRLGDVGLDQQGGVISQEIIDNTLQNPLLRTGDRIGSVLSYDQAIYAGGVTLDKDDSIEKTISHVFDVFGMIISLGGKEYLDSLTVSKLNEAKRLASWQHEGEQSASMIARRGWFPELFEGTRFGERMPSVGSEEIEHLTLSSLKEFASRWYTPAQSTLVIVGDFDTEQMCQIIESTFGEVDRASDALQGRYIDARLAEQMNSRSSLWIDPELETDEIAFIWFEDRDDEAIESWRTSAQSYQYSDAKQLVLSRFVGEIIRYRLNRLAQEPDGLSGDYVEINVDQFDLWGQVDALQIAIERESDGWGSMLEFMVTQLNRLRVDLMSDEEIDRAREAVFARWLRDAADVKNRSAVRRLGYIQWLISSGRPVLEMDHWGQVARDMNPLISNEDVRAALHKALNPKSRVSLVVARNDEELDTQSDRADRYQRLQSMIDQADSLKLPVLSADWYEHIDGSLLNAACAGGEVSQVSLHSQSQVWDALLGNDVRVLARTMDSDPGQGVVSVTLWGDVFFHLAKREELLESALLAFVEPATEYRSQNTIKRFMAEHELRLDVRRDVGFVQLVVESPDAKLREATELLYTIIDRPVVNEEDFESWRSTWNERKPDPIEQGIEIALGISNDQPNDEQIKLELIDAQRALSQLVREAKKDVVISGDIDSEEAIGLATEYFGSLRQARSSNRGNQSPSLQDRFVSMKRSVSVETFDQEEQGDMLVYVSEESIGIQDLRGLFIASMLMNEQLKVWDTESVRFRAQVGYADAFENRVLFFIRSWSREDLNENQLAQMRGKVDDLLFSIIQGDIDQDMLDRMKQRLVSSIDPYFDQSMYWNRRLGSLRARGRSIDEFWRIREGYVGLQTSDIIHSLDQAWRSKDRLEIVIEHVSQDTK